MAGKSGICAAWRLLLFYVEVYYLPGMGYCAKLCRRYPTSCVKIYEEGIQCGNYQMLLYNQYEQLL